MNATPALRIGDVARLSGVRAATLHKWQARYGLLDPARTPGGHRLYSHDDVERVRAVVALVRAGWAVSAAAGAVSRGEPEASVVPTGSSWSAPAGGRRTSGVRNQQAVDSEPGGAALAPRAVETLIAWPSGRRAAASVPDAVLTEVALRATRGLLHARTVEDVVAALVDAVQAVGGTVVPAAEPNDSVLPVDLAFGALEPLLPAATPLSLERLRLEQLLPSLVEDARRVVTLLESGYRQSVSQERGHVGADADTLEEFLAALHRRDARGATAVVDRLLAADASPEMVLLDLLVSASSRSGAVGRPTVGASPTSTRARPSSTVCWLGSL